MSKEENYSPEREAKESTLDFEEAKEMTIGQASRKQEELEAGVTDTDNVLDKYIKQHRAEIEAGKFETQKLRQLQDADVKASEPRATDLADFIRESRAKAESSQYDAPASVGTPTGPAAPNPAAPSSSSAQPSEPAASSSTRPAPANPTVPAGQAGAEAAAPMGSRSSKAAAKIDHEPFVPPTKTSYGPPQPPQEEPELDEPAKKPFYKRKALIFSTLGILGLGAAGTALYFTVGCSLFSGNGGQEVSSSSSSRSSSRSSSSASSSSNQAAALKDFNDAYAAFFTDDKQTAVKNSKFGDLESLNKKLEALKGTSDYDAAKTKYDALVKQISAIQSVNSQFDGGAITDGVLNPNAKANTNATFSEVSSGNAKLDEVLKAAIAQGRSQQTPNPAPPVNQAGGTGGTTAGGNTNPGATGGAAANPASPAGSSSYTGWGLPSDGVNLQRQLSRVPYNQAAIDDVNNPAWTFNPGVLEKILQTSRERGYISGNNFILERVNIVKGNGYYNLFKPDGTYLFSINCKTGYFVGNGPGYADSLDF